MTCPSDITTTVNLVGQFANFLTVVSISLVNVLWEIGTTACYRFLWCQLYKHTHGSTALRLFMIVMGHLIVVSQ